MSEVLVVELVLVVFFSVVTNIIIDGLKIWNKKRKERSLENTLIEDSHPFHISENSTMVPPLPVRITQPVQSPNTLSQTNTLAGGGAIPPALPYRQVRNNMSIEDFPRCPIHKCCNRRGEEQKIFYDSNRKMWKCYHGHNFSS